MIVAGIAILAGTVVACLMPQKVDVFWLSLLPVCVYLAILNTRWRIFWLFCCAILWTSLHVHWQLNQRLTDELNNNRLTVHGEVINIPRRRDGYTRFLFSVSHIEQYDGRLPAKVRLSWRNAPAELQPGQSWALQVKLKRPHGFQNPGGFDYERWLFANGIHATGYVTGAERQQLLDDSAWSIHRVRAGIANAVQDHCQECAQTGLMQALSVGFRGNLSQEVRELLQQTGTAHLIAISGLHIGIISAWFYLLGRGLWRLGLFQSVLSRQQFGLTLGWIAALVYSLVSGFDLPAQRAMLMLTVVFVALWGRYPINLMHSTFVALILILVFAPLSVLSASFWLTFCALLVIGLGTILMRRKTSWWRRLILIQLLFSVLFIPVSIVIFGQIHVSSLLANLIAVPLVSLVIVPFNFILLTLSMLPEGWLNWPYRALDFLLTLLLDYLGILIQYGLSAWQISQPPLHWLLLLLLTVGALILPRGILLPRGWILLLPLLLLWPRDRQQVDLHVAVLDVGMGTAIVVKTRNHSLVYDFGPGNESGYSLGDWVVLPYLYSRDIRHIDRVIISHADQDHMGGILAVHDDLDYTAIYSGTVAQVQARLATHGPIMDCHQAPDWTWDGIEFRFLSAGIRSDASDNNRSCVLLIAGRGQRLLIAGDIEEAQERKLMSDPDIDLNADILVAPHHGSMTSSSPGFIDAVDADHVIFTAGYLNRWRFPRPEVVARYQERGTEIYSTERDGAILIDCENNHCEFASYRQLQPRLWY